MRYHLAAFIAVAIVIMLLISLAGLSPEALAAAVYIASVLFGQIHRCRTFTRVTDRPTHSDDGSK